MTREEIAKKIRWPLIIWIFGFINIGAMLPQLYKILINKSVEGLSLEMFIIYLLVQVAFSLNGYFKRDKVLMICLGLSAFISTIIISLFFIY